MRYHHNIDTNNIIIDIFVKINIFFLLNSFSEKNYFGIIDFPYDLCHPQKKPTKVTSILN